VDSLRQELEKERSRSAELEQKINDAAKPRWAELRASANEIVGFMFICVHVLSPQTGRLSLSDS